MAETDGMSHFPPGEPAPQASKRDLRDPAHLAKLNAAKAEYYALPKEERQRRSAEKKAAREAREAERAAKRAARSGSAGGGADVHDTIVPPTERSQRAPAALSADFEEPARPRAALGPLQGLLDLVAAMPTSFGEDGVSFIQVTRLKPATAFGVPCAGVQKPIWEPIDDSEFLLRYGGGDYSLRGYQAKDTGKVRALTEPVSYRSSGAPNLDSILSEEDAIMRPNPPATNGHPHPAFRRPGIVTPQTASAEAAMHDRTLTHHERRDDRSREERRREREEREERDDRRQNRELSMAELLAKDKEKEMERLRESHERQLELAQSKGKGSGELVELLKHLRPGEDTQGLIRQHSQELRQMADGHKEEMLRLTEGHKEELRRLTEAQALAMHRVEDQARLDRTGAEERAREAERRAGEQIREAERRAAEAVKETERRADQRVTDAQNQARTLHEDLRARSEERITDQRSQFETRLSDLKGAHDRELRAKDSEITLMRSNLEGNQAVILQTKDAEIKRLQHELRVAKDDAEKNKDWMARAAEFDEHAERMGYSKGEGGEGGDEDLKTTIAKAGMHALGRLPELVSAGADAVSKLRNPGVPPDVARSQVRSGMVRGSMHTQPRALARGPQLTFATEDGGYTPPPDQEPPRPFVAAPQFEPAPLPAVEQPQLPQQTLVPPPAPSPAPPPMAAAPPPDAPRELPPAGAVPPQSAEAMQPTTPTAPPPAEPAAELHPMAPQIIGQLTPVLLEHYSQKAPPEAVAGGLVAGNPVEMIRLALDTVSIEQFVAYLKQTPGAHAALVTRSGEKFLREVWRNIAQAVAQ